MATNSLPRISARLLPILAVVGISASLCSCDDAEIANLRAERRVRAAVAELRKARRAVMQSLSTRLASLEEHNGSLAAQLEDAMTASGNAVTPTLAQAGPAEPLSVGPDEAPDPEQRKIATYRQNGISGVPPQIAAEILRKAGRDTRSWAALEQIEAEGAGYRTVQAFALSQTKMLREDRDELVSAAKREHPGEWAKMACHIEEQVDAWTILEEWKVKGVPGLESWESEAVLCAAAERYRYDWASSLHAVKEASRAEVAGRENPRDRRRH